MTITFSRRKKKYHLEEEKISVKEALQKLGFSLEGHLILRNEELLTENELLRDGDYVKLIAVISGGSKE